MDVESVSSNHLNASETSARVTEQWAEHKFA